MALVVKSKRAPSSSWTDPQASLIAALQDFEAILSVEQKLIYKSTYATPGAQDVVAFVSRIDADNKGRAQRCVAPRLCTFLEGTVQFTNIVDTFASSNPAIAALVWGSLKTAILTASNVASYFDKITDMIMKIGRSCPTYQQFGLLYSSSVSLQGALCQYYAIIIRLCIKIISISQRTALMQMFSPVFNPFEAEFKPFIVDLAQAVKDIQIQISLASKKAVEEESRLSQLERERSSTHRKLLQQISSDTRNELKELRARVAARDEERKKKDLLDRLSKMDHLKGWRQAKGRLLPGTAEWFRQNPDFVKWSDSDTTSILWCSGILGSGKTTLVANIIAHIMSHRSASDIIAYHFCHFDDEHSVNATEIIGSITRQILNNRIDRLNFDMLHQKLELLSPQSDVINWIFSLLESNTCIYLVLDGLDECDGENLVVLSRVLATLVNGRRKIPTNRQGAKLKLLCTGRPELENQLFRSMAPNNRITLRGAEVEKDICNYTSTVLDQCLQDGRLKLRDPNLILRIAEVLYNEAQGMFLWTKLLIDEICQQESDSKIVEALGSLPKDLTALFHRKLQRIKTNIKGMKALDILQWCGVARRPLSISELEELLSLEIGQSFLDHTSFPNDIYSIIEACSGLAYVDEEDFTVHYAHHSVKQHLFEDVERLFAKEAAELKLGLLCLTYVNLQNLKGQLSKVSLQQENMIDPIAISLRAINPVSNKTASIARTLLQKIVSGRQIKTTQLSKQLQDAIAIRDVESIETPYFAFLDYAKAHWITHLQKLTRDHTYWWSFIRTIAVNLSLAEMPWMRSEHNPLMFGDTLGSSLWIRSTIRNTAGVEGVAVFWDSPVLRLLSWSINHNIPSTAVAVMELISAIAPGVKINYDPLNLSMLGVAYSCTRNKSAVAHALTKHAIEENILPQRLQSMSALEQRCYHENISHEKWHRFAEYHSYLPSIADFLFYSMQPDVKSEALGTYTWIDYLQRLWDEQLDVMLLLQCLQRFPNHISSRFYTSLFEAMAQHDITKVSKEFIMAVAQCDIVLPMGIDKLLVNAARRTRTSLLCDSLLDYTAHSVDLTKLNSRLFGHQADLEPRLGGLLTLFGQGYKTTSTIRQYFRRSPLISIDDVPGLETQCAGAEVFTVWQECRKLVLSGSSRLRWRNVVRGTVSPSAKGK